MKLYTLYTLTLAISLTLSLSACAPMHRGGVVIPIAPVIKTVTEVKPGR